MKRIFQRIFFPALLLILLLSIIALAYGISVEKKSMQPNIRLDPYFHAPQDREDVIVYFKEMPSSIEEFASSYGVTPIFVKDDIKMAAFETSPTRVPGVTSQKTKELIEQISKDPLVESVKVDTFMFTDKKSDIKAMPEVITPEDLDKNGTIYSHEKVIVGFWRFPPSLEDFAAKYGGRLVNLTEGDRNLLTAMFETDDMTGFINNVSKDPYVRYVEPNIVGHVC
ncbi:hypothetical protein Mtc_0291 [Methanocella conradii HZ254]|uniref:Uncharacterized protein n=1 Tax=Methanocella conradii (strain DSM 24694 / JCM 17849 / CGMCC 1.5162 / HZ254) TaxID=1041930 RepID=H8I959_METCZ|nr:hypothetical protein [Methanocella conradii]AFC99062.1 hypothetical protein Mtc_0291 [Methanocella conradii HZ254]